MKKAGFERAVAYYVPNQTNFRDKEEAFLRVSQVAEIPAAKEEQVK